MDRSGRGRPDPGKGDGGRSSGQRWLDLELGAAIHGGLLHHGREREMSTGEEQGEGGGGDGAGLDVVLAGGGGNSGE